MKKPGSLLAIAAAAGMAFNATVVWAGDGGNVLGGIVTGALIGSVFGPDKKARGKNAMIGAVGGALIGSQIGNAYGGGGNAYDSGNAYDGGREDWRDSGHRRHEHRHSYRNTTTIIEQAPEQTVIVAPSREVQTVVVDEYGRTKAVIIEPRQETRTYIRTTPSRSYYDSPRYRVVESGY